jgi:catechol 2,3-dioxygenase-like lactoylglutathione lyase family enzyme
MKKPNPTNGLRHVALFIKNFDACEKFYVEQLGMTVEWRPDADNLYLTTGADNFAMHRAQGDFLPVKPQRLDHFGFFLNAREDVDEWHDYLAAQGADIKAKPKDHRDGTRSFYVADPDGNVVQMIWVPVKG